MSALERTEATPAAAQAILDNVMGDQAPESQQGDSVVTKLARVTEVAFDWKVDHGLLDSYGDETATTSPTRRLPSVPPRG